MSLVDLESMRRDELRKAQNKARCLFEDILAEGLIAAGRQETEVEGDIFQLAKNKYGVKFHWHKRVVRAGPNSMTVYRIDPPDLVIGEDDIVYVDLGPVFGEWEADFGRSFVVGHNAQKLQLVGALPRMHAIGRAHFEQDEALTGAGLFEFMQKTAAEDGWSFGGEIAGHIIGEFPHNRIPGEENTFLIAPENVTRLRDPDENGHVKHWILEVHLIDPTRSFGGFYEELITV